MDSRSTTPLLLGRAPALPHPSPLDPFFPPTLTLSTQYSKHGQAYVLPHILTGPEIVLPLSQAKWLVEQPEHVLSQTEVNRQFLEADHTFLHPNIVREPVHPGVIRRELTHKLEGFATGIVRELELCLEANWGTDTEAWREVRVYDSMLDVISRLSTRVFVGEDLCRNEEFLKGARGFDRNVVVAAAGLNLLPGFLKPCVVPPFSIFYLQPPNPWTTPSLPAVSAAAPWHHNFVSLPLVSRRIRPIHVTIRGQTTWAGLGCTHTRAWVAVSGWPDMSAVPQHRVCSC